MIYVENKDLVIPGEVLADDEYYSGRGTFKAVSYTHLDVYKRQN